MKNISTLLLCLIIFSIGATSQNLVAWYKFNGNVNDYSGNNLNGSLVGPQQPAPTTDCSGTLNESYSFPGYPGSFVANGIDVPHSPLLNPGAYLSIDITFTLSQITGLNPYNNSYCSAFDLLDKGTDQDNGWYGMRIDPTNEPTSGCGAASGFGKLLFGIRFSDGTYGLAYSNNILDTGVCYHAVGIYNGSTISLTLNGVLQQTVTVNKTLGLTTKKLTIGYNDDLPVAGYWFNGKIDDLKIYNNPNAPGSGNAISFSGVNDYINIPNSTSLTLTGDMTLEAWVNVPSMPLNSFIWIMQKGFTAPFGNTPFWMYFDARSASGGSQANPVLVLGLGAGGNYYNTTSSPLNTIDGKWMHVVAVVSSNVVTLYVNGVPVTNNSVLYNSSGTPIGTSFSGTRQQNISPVELASNQTASVYSKIKEDEIRVWNSALTQTQIRDWMCKKVTSAHPAYANLMAYYRFDEGTGTTVADLTGNNPGTLVNSPKWITSGAGIGDASAYNYSASPSATLAHPQGESLTATATSGLPDGIQIYRVDSIPNDTTGARGIGINNRYFGVFVAGGTSPQYTAIYNYNGNPYVTDKNSLHLYERANNSDSMWTDAGAINNTTTNTLTVTGQHTEYILGGTSLSALPVTLLNLQAKYVSNNNIEVSWQTSSEQNNKGFEVYRSTDGINFSIIGFVHGAVNSNILLNYNYSDNSTLTGKIFYRIRQVDEDGNSKFSPIVYVIISKQNMITFSPNPADNFITILSRVKVKEINLINTNGQLIKKWNNISPNDKLNISDISKGIYIIKFINDDFVKTQKLMKE